MRSKLNANINITPLVDVFLVLICILILGATVSVKSLTVNVPDTQYAAGVKAAQTLKIRVASDGSTGLYDSLEIIQIEVLAAKIDPKSTTVAIYADQNIPYAALAKILDKISAANPKEVQLVTQ